jgi:HK97 family phage major capsid protein
MFKPEAYEEQKAKAIQKIADAVKSGNAEDASAAVTEFCNTIYEKIIGDYKELQGTHDEQALTQRGYRQLTSAEQKFYEGIMESVKASDAKQALLTAIPDGAMPTTIIEDVYKELKAEHPLLSKINFRFVGYITKWILSDHSTQKAVWGKITDAITKEIASGLKEVDVHQNKLSAFVLISKGLIDMGPTFLDAYVREVLAASLAYGLEDGIVNGNGVDCPIGMTRDIHDGVSFSTSTGYPLKTAIKLKSFRPKEYGDVLSKLAKTEKGNDRTFGSVILITNMTDYLTKVMPATTVLNGSGAFVKDVFPFATETIVSSAVATGKAIIGIPEEYSLLAGGDKNGVIEFSDDYKFVEDQRAYKIKQYATGRAYDNTCFLLLDISELEELYVLVKNMAEKTTVTA